MPVVIAGDRELQTVANFLSPPLLHCCVIYTVEVVAGGAVVGVLPSDRVLGLVPFHPGCGVSASPTPGLYEVSIPSFHAPPTIEVLPSWHTNLAD